MPAATFPAGWDLPNWKDVAPRLGLAYDLFGDSSTALKVSWGRYNAANTGHVSVVVPPRDVPRRTGATGTTARSARSTPNRCATRAELEAVGFDPEIAFGEKGGTHVGRTRAAITGRTGTTTCRIGRSARPA